MSAASAKWRQIAGWLLDLFVWAGLGPIAAALLFFAITTPLSGGLTFDTFVWFAAWIPVLGIKFAGPFAILVAPIQTRRVRRLVTGPSQPAPPSLFASGAALGALSGCMSGAMLDPSDLESMLLNFVSAAPWWGSCGAVAGAAISVVLVRLQRRRYRGAGGAVAA